MHRPVSRIDFSSGKSDEPGDSVRKLSAIGKVTQRTTNKLERVKTVNCNNSSKVEDASCATKIMKLKTQQVKTNRA